MVKVLFTTPILEHPPAGGPQLRIENSIKALSRVCELYIMARSTMKDIGGDDAVSFYRQYCKEFMLSPSFSGLSDNRYIRKLQRAYHKVMNSDLNAILNFVDDKQIDVIWFGYGNISFSLEKKLKQKRPNLKVVCDTDSVWSRFILRELPFENDTKRKAKIEKRGRKKEQEEKELVNICDITTAVSEVDAEYYRNLAKEPERIKIFSNVIDVDNYKNIPPPPAAFKRHSIYLAGTFGPKSPMDKAARWAINEVLPIIKKQIPDIHFYIVGRGSKETLNDINDQNISIIGKLPSVLPYLGNTDISVVPLWFESGTRFKILEAGACKRPVVSTTLGAEGLPVSHGKNILIADSPDEFANAIVKLIKNRELANNLAENLHSLVCSKFSIESLELEACNILDSLKVSK